MTISACTQLPVLGNLELIFGPKKPSSHKTSRMTMRVHIRFFLLKEHQGCRRAKGQAAFDSVWVAGVHYSAPAC
jgi:hypothetical protein